MYLLAPSLGRVVTPASYTVTTAVVNALATGTVDASRNAGKWMIRPDAVTAAGADRTRLTTATGYVAATGTLAHAGANYADTTATNETLEISEYEPYLLDNAIQATLPKLRRIDRTMLPTVQGANRYYPQLSWVTDPAGLKIFHRNSRVMTNNRFLEKWNAYSSVGALIPDNWTLSVTGATFARSGTARRGAYALAVTTSGGNAGTVDAVIPVMASGSATSGDSLRGQTVTGVGVSLCGAASSQRVRVTSEDASGVVLSTTNSSYHTGGGTWEELTAAHVVHADAEQIRIQFRQEQNETAKLVDELYLVFGSVDNQTRYDTFDEAEISEFVRWEQGNGTLAMVTPVYGIGAQLIIESERGYPAFDASRVSAGTADQDVSDAPLIHVATGGIAHLFRSEAMRRGEDTSKATYEGSEWMAKFETLAQMHRYQRDTQGGGLPLPGMPLILSGRY